MRSFVCFFTSLFSLIIVASEVDKNTYYALDYIKQGFVQYGFSELKKVAVSNGIAGQYYVAICYEHGIGVEKDMTQAFWMYRKAAERGLPDAMYHIASFYRNGVVVSQDSSREQEWLKRYNQKGGKLVLPDLIQIYNEGKKHPDNYAMNPKGGSNNHSILVAQDNGNSQKQTINNITIVQQSTAQNDNSQQPADSEKSDVDVEIPLNQQIQDNTFAIIIANENYKEVEVVPYAVHDGETFRQYCEKTLGIPKNNIKFVTNATFNNIKRELNWISQVMDVYQGKANIIFYYSGHGIPDEKSGAAYLLPVDGYCTDVTTGYCLDNIYAELSSKPAKSVVVLLDACFSGAKRDGGMLASARGVAIKAKQNAPKGNMVVLSAAQGDETAYPFNEKGHGLFTYYLLKKLQETKGDVTFGELADYVTTEVKKQSIVTNGKMQTPLATPSSNATDWRNWKLR